MKNHFFLTLFLCLLTASLAVARPAKKGAATITLPDGKTVTVTLHGDEFCHFTTTTDGYNVVKGADGYYRYATLQDGVLVPTSVKAYDAAFRTDADKQLLADMPRMQRPEMTAEQKQLRENAAKLYTAENGAIRRGPAKLLGGRIDYSKFKGLVILVEFQDRSFLREDANAFFNNLYSTANLTSYEHDGKTVEVSGSTRDYFRENSNGIFDPTFDVVGPVKIDYTCTAAKGNSNVYNLIKAALKGANDQVNYKDYDLDGDGAVDMVYFLFAGYGSYVQGNNADYIWPHASDLSYYSKYYGLRFDGTNFSRYACSVEIQDVEDYSYLHQYLDGIGTMCHEFSHVLGLADHYDTDYEQSGGQSSHPDAWDLMAGGADNNMGLTPVGYNGYERYALGFANAMPLDVAGSYTLEPFNASSQCYRLETGTSGENFFIENRQKTAWDTYLPSHGMLVWRVDSTNTNVWQTNKVNCTPSHQYYQLMSASGDLSKAAAVPFPGTTKMVDFTRDTHPALMSWHDTPAAIDLYDITETNGVVTFNAGINLYESASEDFETMALTTDDATNQQGTFCSWDLVKATVVATADGAKGNDSQSVKMERSSSITSSAINRGIRDITLHVWTGAQPVKIAIRNNATGAWKYVKTVAGKTQTDVTKNSDAYITCRENLAAGGQLQIQMLATSSSAVAYIDDIQVTYTNEDPSGIVSISQDATNSNAPAYNISGQRVNPNFRGLIIQNGKKTIRK